MAKKSIEDRSTKVSQQICDENCSKKKLESRRRSVSKIAPRKFPNRCASRIARRKFGSWRKRPSKITARKFSNRSNRHLEVGKEVSKIAPRKFPSDVRRESLEENLEVGENVHRRSLHESFSTDQTDIWKLAKKYRRSLHESFPTGVCRELLEEEIRKFAKKFIEDRSTKVSQQMCVENRSTKIWKLAKTSIKDCCTQISQQMCVKNCSKKTLEVVVVACCLLLSKPVTAESTNYWPTDAVEPTKPFPRTCCELNERS